jgi:hypothetical protein
MLTDECDNTDPEPEPESEPTNVPFADGDNFFADRFVEQLLKIELKIMQ